jgi:hypothetical protein
LFYIKPGAAIGSGHDAIIDGAYTMGPDLAANQPLVFC